TNSNFDPFVVGVNRRLSCVMFNLGENSLWQYVPCAAPAADPVFAREGSQGRFDTRSWFQPCLEEAKIASYVWHSNRHTFCSWLAMAGASIKEIQELAGHKTITMSARYSHLSREHRLSVIDRIATVN
ncbi:MAG TPA: tyrosine-type recombinase/integrase, partial [Terriglobales bacterium]|nr:tyrosine-type recombinase/integrase [Terriglobales bacterium]